MPLSPAFWGQGLIPGGVQGSDPLGLYGAGTETICAITTMETPGPPPGH